MENKLRGREISELKIGIIGFGRIGKNLFKYFNAMNSQVCFHDPFCKFNAKDFPQIKKIDDLYQLLKISDVVITSVTLNKTTFKLVNKEFLNRMKKGAVLINTSRGDVVDEEALLEALITKKLVACGLDVLSNENKKNFLNESKLFKYAKENDNLIITPHIAGLSIDSESKAQHAAFNLLLNSLM